MPIKGKPLPETKAQRKAREAETLKNELTLARLKREMRRKIK